MNTTPARTALMAAIVSAVGVAPTARGQEAAPAAAAAPHVMVTPADLQWAEGPPSLPAGARFAVIEGDPKSPPLFTMRLKLPVNYRIPAHWHPADEHVTVLAGAFHMGLGGKLDAAKGHRLGAGSFAVMPAKAQHYAWTSEETILQLHGMGPWGINYVNPADDPRKK